MSEKIISLLKGLAKKESVTLCKRGNTAIKTALALLPKHVAKIGIPDMGGWITYSQFAKKRTLEIIELKTDRGVIDPQQIPAELNNGAIIYAHPAAYYAEQPYKEIYAHCRKYNIVCILDATGSLGAPWYEGGYADIVLGSFAETKPIDVGYGGFIAMDTNLARTNTSILDNLEFNHDYDTVLGEKLVNLKNRYEFFAALTQKVKQDLAQGDMFHQEKQGINVMVGFANENEKDQIISYCNREDFEYVECPRNIKVMEDAISIEIKRKK